jgi:hypothetical protein
MHEENSQVDPLPLSNITRRLNTDLIAVIVLIALCGLFFWRILTPNPINQVSLVEGDFSGQFVAFAHYQAVRLGQGQVPLWNPYNYGGHPFLADTQSAVFYPPRLLTIAALNLTGGSTPQRMYGALQLEMALHALLASLLMYAFVRRLTFREPYRVIAGMVAGLTFAYGGYLMGYPQLQLAVMEAGIWIPLALLGIYEATNHDQREDKQVGWRWLLLAGVALGLSFMAGHPQTTFFLIYFAVAYLGWRVWRGHYRWWVFVAGAAIFGLVGGGLAAVQLLPGLEYTRLTVRTTMNVDAMGNGFPFYDLLQIIFPGMLSLWSPLYFGIAALGLVIYAVWRRVADYGFWLVAALIALVLSFGHNTVLFDVFYNVVPGASLFRGQERSAYLIAVCVSVLAGLGAARLLNSGQTADETLDAKFQRRYKIALWAIAGFAGLLMVTLFVNWLLTNGSSASSKWLGNAAFSVLISIATALLLTNTLTNWQKLTLWRSVGIVVLIVIELFSFGRTNPNWESIPVSARLITPSNVQAIRTDSASSLARVDGSTIIGANFGTLYGVNDIQGISPLRLLTVDRALKLPINPLWEVFAVQYIPTANNELPVPSTIITKQDDPTTAQSPINLHKLTEPRPFAHLVYKTWVEPDDNSAFGIMSDPSYDARNTVMLSSAPVITLPTDPPNDSTAEVTQSEPELLTIKTHSSSAAILSLSLVYYPGWQATIDGQMTELLRADGAFTALVAPAGDHTIQLTYQPISYTIGAIVSLITLIVLALGALFGLAVFIKSTRR